MNGSSGIELVERAAGFGERTAVVDAGGNYSYAELLRRSGRVADYLLGGRKDLEEARVCFLAPRGFDYVWVQWGIWRAGGIAVPLCDQHPPPEMEHVITDADAEVVAVHPDYAGTLRPLTEKLGRRLILTTEIGEERDAGAVLPELDSGRRAMILYTSGSTGRPKGVVATHGNIEAQVKAQVEAWAWQKEDRIVNVLPLHHVHGIVNVLTCALWSGAVCEFMPKFDAGMLWERFLAGGLSLFMAVPTIYNRLIEAYAGADAEKQAAMREACRGFRLMVSGSAALPVPVLEKWREISGHTLLERYGMTEIGMALTNPLHGERRPGFVGQPFPSVEARLVDDEGKEAKLGETGEIEVRGPSVFEEYWRLPEATAEAFREGWFQTGDVAVMEEGAYRILGRKNVDIIKTGGYKVSALEIESVLREHPAVREAAVVGCADVEWGERVCAAVVCAPGEALDLEALRAWAGERLARYKLPTRLQILDTLPRNVMGKVVKGEVRKAFE